MADPLDKATSKAPATLGEGCLSRYDPDEMSPEDGTDFPGGCRSWLVGSPHRSEGGRKTNAMLEDAFAGKPAPTDTRFS
ncbi:hypothetical protein [Pseudomonas sp. MHK4]|jgi:hypothetical protein